MKNLSIVIKEDNVDKIRNYIKVLKPLLEDNNTQLIIINNIVDEMDLNYNYTIYKFRESYDGFKEFCLAACLYDNIIILESGIILNENVIKVICDNLNDVSIIVKIKKYIDFKKEEYYIQKQSIVNNYTSNKIIEADIEVEDESLINANYTYLKHNIYKFIEDKKCRELYLWYKNVILNTEELKLKFYEELEKLKIDLHNDTVMLIEEQFLKECLDLNYEDYLRIKKMCFSKSKKYGHNILNNIKNIKFTEEKYFSYFIFRLFRENNMITDIFKILDFKIKKSVLNYLYETYEDFYLYVYNYIISMDIIRETSFDNNENVNEYVYIIKTYIENMSSKSADCDKKNKLLQMFTEYVNYGLYLLSLKENSNEQIVIDNEIRFLIEIDKAIGYLNNSNIKKTIQVLNKASEIFDIMTITVRYYIQRLLFENKFHYYKISICMIVKNEEKNIDRCLKSIKALVDSGIAELIIVDTGSTDKTIEILKKHTQKIYYYEWKGDFSEARNFSVSIAGGEYIFIIDADEYLDVHGITKIKQLFNSDEYEKYSTYTFSEVNFSSEDLTEYSIFTRPFIFRNEESFCYTGQIHEQPNLKHPVNNLDVKVFHTGYIMNEHIEGQKYKRTVLLLQRELEKDPYNIYYRYQLSLIYGKYEYISKSLEQVELYMKYIRDSWNKISNGFNLMYFNNAIMIYIFAEQYQKALETCDRGLVLQKDFIDFLYHKGRIFFYTERYKNATYWFRRYISLLEEFSSHEIVNDSRYEFYSIDKKDAAITMMSLSYKEYINKLINSGEVDEAERKIKEYMLLNNGDIDVYSMKAVVLIMKNKLEEAEKVLLDGLKEDNNNFDLLYNTAYLYSITNNNELALEYYKKALRFVKDENLKKSIEEIINNLDTDYK